MEWSALVLIVLLAGRPQRQRVAMLTGASWSESGRGQQMQFGVNTMKVMVGLQQRRAGAGGPEWQPKLALGRTVCRHIRGVALRVLAVFDMVCRAARRRAR